MQTRSAASQLIFEARSIALNNALFTVSPLNGFFLYGELKNASEFEKAVLIYSFGLVGYLPALPDPYAADLGEASRQYGRYQQDKRHRLDAIRALLVALMPWEGNQQPAVAFSFGPLQKTALPAAARPEAGAFPSIAGISSGTHTADQRLQERAARVSARFREASETSTLEAERLAYLNRAAAMQNGRIQNSSIFNLLDVSTAAGLMGISFGAIDERALFQEEFEVAYAPENLFAVQGMDVVAHGRFVRMFSVPQISWEPVLILAPQYSSGNDPEPGLLLFPNDGDATYIGNTGARRR